MARLSVYNVNDFILDQIGTDLGYDGSGIRPIFPIQSVPEANQQQPHLVYSGITLSDARAWWTSIDEVTYTIMHNDPDTINDIVKELKDIFRRMDLTADEMNDFCDTNDLEDYFYYSFRFMGSTTSRPAEQENGLYAQPFTIRYSYSENAGRSLA